MKQVLFIRPDANEDGKIAWCISGQQQVNVLDNRAALSTLADSPLATRVCLLLPASELVFRQFTLPKKGLSIQSAPFSWLAEETLIGDVDTLHWTVLRKKGREVDAVAIDAERLRFWLSLCEKAGLNVIQVLPDAILLPVSEGGATLVSCGDSWWLRAAPFSACEADAALMPFLTRDLDGDICCYGDVPSGVVITEQRAWQHPLTLIQPQWKTCRANMLHGPFLASGTHGFRHGKAMLAAAVALSVGLMIGPRIAMAWMLVQQENQAQEEIVQVAQHYFPSLRQQTNIKYHFGQNLKTQPKGVFLQLDALAQIKKNVPAVELSQLEYNEAQNQLTLSLSSPDPQAIQSFVNQASGSFDFTLQPVSTQAPFTAIVTGKYK
ncbi:type II secretion system protein GspL [Citrobacter sedlakii]|uniref:type II secretion system protein GspL n=1 Tax=Citrobacter TaxID=544 RepID=UPI0018FF9689|nr:type II secretion system protein GspL [Citrobacter sedlakii]MBJ9886685.1 type II secretion system protein GspL [Citrobacter sedlakii]MCK8146150.1 type II secretion system protein GspL [Citrobacter sedlakii]